MAALLGPRSSTEAAKCLPRQWSETEGLGSSRSSLGNPLWEDKSGSRSAELDRRWPALMWGTGRGPPPAHWGCQGWQQALPCPGVTTVLPQTGAWRTLAPGVFIPRQGHCQLQAAQPWAELSRRQGSSPDLQASERQSPPPTRPTGPGCVTSSSSAAGPEIRVLECGGPNLQQEVLSEGTRANTTAAEVEARHQDRLSGSRREF